MTPHTPFRFWKPRRLWAAGVFCLLLLVGLPVFGEELSQMAARLVTLRGEVETLAARLEDQKAQTREQLRSLARQKADVESQIQRETLRIQRLRQSITAQHERLAATAELDSSLSPLVLEGIEALRGVVEKGLPFSQRERLAELEDLRAQVVAGSLPAARALARLWAFAEDEFRLARESGLYRQTIPLEGHDVLADVARVGMVMLYFRAGDQVGQVRREGETFRYERLTDAPRREQVLALFDGLKKQIRQGYYLLPNGLPPIQELAP